MNRGGDADYGSEHETEKEMSNDRELLDVSKNKLLALHNRVKEWNQRIQRLASISAEEVLEIQ